MRSFMLMLMLVPNPQEPSTGPTRAEELQQAREQKAKALQPPSRSWLEKGLYKFKEERVMERIQAGFFGVHPLLGGMQTGSGFAMGGSYIKDGFQLSGQRSLKGYEKYDLRFSAPPLLGDRISAEVHATYRNYTQEDFFGTGLDSRTEDRTNYRQEDFTYGAQLEVRLKDHLKAGGGVNWIETNVGAGTDHRFPSVASVFDPNGAPALDNQPSYLQTSAFLEFDNRDQPGNPRSGGRYVAKLSSYEDRKLGRYDFAQYEMEAQQYFPFFNQRRVVALRAKTVLTGAADGQEIPFYMQPTLGGSEDLRGYNEFRFRDENMVVFNAEYRWEAFSGLDLALFGDAGHVAPTVRDLDLGSMKTAAGFGFRFNTAKSVFLRVDVGFSNEGSRVFMKFGHVF